MINGRATGSGFDFTGFDAYLFDIDGTLLNSRDWVHYNAFHMALRSVYACHQKIDDVPVQGNTDVGILRAAARLCGIEDEKFDSGIPQARSLMGEEVERHAADLNPELCPGVGELLNSIHESGKLLGVCTGNFERIGWAKLTAAGIRSYFNIGSFSDEHEFRQDIFRNGVEKARQLHGNSVKACFIGDTPNDILAARHLGIPVIAVATGIYTLEHLQTHSPTQCVGCCRELL